MTVVSFAAPRFVDADFKVVYENLAIQAVRYENRDDIVPHIPPSPQFQARVGAGRMILGLLLPAGYVSVGELRFINWAGAIVGDSPALELARLNQLLSLLKTPVNGSKSLHRDHVIDCVCAKPRVIWRRCMAL